MPVITLDEMSHIRLMDRIDTKYVAHVSLLPQLLDRMQTLFKVQIIDDKKIANYTTQYFDTSSWDFFTMHQNGKLKRQKIRIRSYTDSNLSFLEIKNKNNKGRTSKKRIPVSVSHVDTIDNLKEEQHFLDENSFFSSDKLLPILENNFQRMTFVNNKETERITIDVGLSFLNYSTDKKRCLDDLMVLELKQDGWKRSDFAEILQQMRIKRSSFSKYCMGMVLTNPASKYNRFKGKVQLLNKFLQLSL